VGAAGPPAAFKLRGLRADQIAMVAIDRFILLVRDLRRDQRGLAVPTALMALIATFALASVTVMSTIDVQRGTARDHDSKEAIAAADAGASIAMLRLNRYLPTLTTGVSCIGTTGLSQPASGGWCPKTTPEKVGEAEFEYQVSAYGTSKTVEVVAWGRSGSVTRRVDVGLQAIDGKNVFADEKVIGEEGIEFSGSAAEVFTDLGTNGEISNSGNSKPTLCGNGRHGVGKGPVPPLSCGGEETEGNMILPPIVPPANIATVNDDCRLLEKAPTGCTGTDVYVPEKNNAKRSETLPWYAKGKVITVKNNATLTLGGHNYFVCQLIVEGGKLYMPFNTEVNIYIDTPEHCGLAAGAVQFKVMNNGEVLSTAFNPSQESYAIPNIYLLGNGSVYLKGNPTSVSSEKGATSNEVMIYGPQSTIEFDGSATWKGMVAGKKVIIKGNGRIESSSKYKKPEQNLTPLFERTRYVECAGTATSLPNANC
jgi:Tfp pilus assembly protein PilX